MMESILNYIANSTLLYGFSALFIAAICSIYFVPTIRKLALYKNLTDSPSARGSHTNEVPVIGGVAIYSAAAFSMFIIAFIFPSKIGANDFFLLGFGSLVLLFVGIVDDLIGLKPIFKLIFQLVVCFVLIYSARLYISDMYGLFGFSEISYVPSLLLSVFVFVVFVNMFNLIDGIDGLASGISVVAYSFFAYVAFFDGNYYNMLMSMAGVGCLIPFMYYNMFSGRKIFLGDNGSLVLGLVLGYLCIDLISSNNTTHQLLFGDNKIIVLMSLFSYPLVDTLRVFILRIVRKRSPFSADKNHIHHHLLRLGLSHRKATLAVILYTFFITYFSFLLTGVGINTAFILLLLISILVICFPSILIKKDDGSISFRKKANPTLH
jgi:UDP-GlcNAc:undecaprenyl-phosphate GlcNAc-1-phosphate transferase